MKTLVKKIVTQITFRENVSDKDDRRKAMFELNVNMKQMNKFQVYSDNVIAYDQIIQSKGKFSTNRPDIYTPWLNEYGIFYTLKGPK